MKHFLSNMAITALLATNLSSCSPKNAAPVTSTPPRIEHDLVMVAHGDDWQIFAGDTVADYLLRGDFVTMVQLTAGVGIKDCWEKGFLASVVTAIDRGPNPYIYDCRNGSSYAPFVCQNVTVNGHSVFKCWYKNATVYFMRISGTWDYSTGHRPDEIVAGISKEGRTLRDLYRNHYTSPFTTVDQSATYANFDDLVQTIAAISGKCTEGYYGMFGWCHTSRILSPNPAGTLSPGKSRDHEDHATTGCVAVAVAESIAAIDIELFSGYDNATKPDSQIAKGYTLKDNLFRKAFGGTVKGDNVDVDDAAYIGPQGWLRYTTWGNDTLPPHAFPDDVPPFWKNVGNACNELRTTTH